MNPVMKFLKNVTKGKKRFFNIFLLLVVVVLIGVVYKYNGQKLAIHDNMDSNKFASVGTVSASTSGGSSNSASNAAPASASSSGSASNSAPSGVKPVETTDGKQFLNVNGMASTASSSTNCNNKPVMDPKELLPTDNNSEWSNIMPNNDLKKVGMLNAGHHVGVNTVGSSLRNPNLQIRSEPVIPQTNIGPWNNTTMEADNMRRPLEIGSAN